MGEWIEFEMGTERGVIPEHTRLLLCDAIDEIVIGVFDYGDYAFYPACGNEPEKGCGAYINITHWTLLELPEKPKESKLIPCPHCGKDFPIQWAGWWEMLFFGSLACPFCGRKIGLEAKLVKREG